MAARENAAAYGIKDDTSNVFSYMPEAQDLEVEDKTNGKEYRSKTDSREYAKSYRRPILQQKSNSFKRGADDDSSTTSQKKFRWGSTKEYAVPRAEYSTDNIAVPKDFLNFKFPTKMSEVQAKSVAEAL